MNQSEQLDHWTNFFNDTQKDALAETAAQDDPIHTITESTIAKHTPDLAKQLIETPEQTINAAHQALQTISVADTNTQIRINQLPDTHTYTIRNIRTQHLQTLIHTKALIKKTSDVMPKLQAATFECTNCGDRIEKQQDSTNIKTPYKCDCGNRNFTLVQKDLQDIQYLTLEEIPSMLNNQDQPQQIQCKVTDELVDPDMQQHLTPGNKVDVYAIPRERPKNKDKGLYEIYLDAHYIEPDQQILTDIEIQDNEQQAIEDYAQRDDTTQRIIDSICPSIKGHRTIKHGIALQLFGGVRKTRQDQTETRGDIHVLLIGEPGTGKSMMLQFIEQASPKARYTVGNTATQAGVTATVTKDEMTGEWSLEAGLLPLSHNGIACIDEIDKMEKKERSSMHESLEQGQISVSKANIQATLNAQASVLAAGNPVHGRFDKYSEISEQIEISDTLISRFDLIFPVLDEPDRDDDTELAEHMTKMHANPDQRTGGMSTDLLRKYVAYAQKHVEPQLTEDARNLLEDFYVDTRQQGASDGPEERSKIPITPRQLEALIRMSEAQARMELSDTVEPRHAEQAIEMLTASLEQIGVIGDDGTWDADKLETGMSTEQRDKRQVLQRIFDQLKKDSDDQLVDVNTLIERLADNRDDMTTDDAEDFIRQLRQNGEYFSPKTGKIGKV